MADNDAPDNDETEDGQPKKGLGRKFLGLFVESAEAPVAPVHKSIADEDDEEGSTRISRVSRPTMPAVVPTPAPVVSPTGVVRPTPPQSYKPPDFSGIYKTVGMPDDDRDRLAKTEDLLKNLPAETPVALKKQIVEGTLRAFGIAPEKIVQAATRAVVALDKYVEIGSTDLQQRLEATQKRVAELIAEQERLAAALAERKALQNVLEFDVRARQSDLRQIVEFFGPATSKP